MARMTYCRRWNPVLKEAAEILQPEEAESLHRSRQPYSVVLEADAGGAVIVEMCFYQAYCHVLFLDELKRVANRYSFVETGDGRLFLEEAAVHNYRDSSERASDGELFSFKQDGSLSHKTGKTGGPISRREGKTNISRNYAALPTFGDYSSIVSRER
jgi:hypothetical protein